MKKTILIAALFIGCTKSYLPPPDTIVVTLSAPPLTLDPRLATDATGARIAGLIFSSFARVGDDFSLIPEAAESWEKKGSTYHFYLRPDLRFHNGRAVEPEDVDFSWETFRGPGSPFASSLKSVKAISTRRDTEGRLIMTVDLHGPSASFLLNELPTIKILPKKETLAAGLDFSTTLMGSGPYRFVHQKLNEIRLKGERTATPHLVFKIIRDDFTRYQKMLKGEVDISQNDLPQEKIEEFQKRPDDFQVLTYPGLNMTYLLINLRDPVLKNKEARLALAQAMNRDEIIKYKMRGLAAPAATILTPNNPYFNSAVQNPPFAPDQARKLFAKWAGTRLTLKTSNTPGAIDGGRVLASQIGRIGAEVRHESYEWATYYDDIKKGHFQLATMKWVGIVDPEIYRSAFHSSETPPGRNRGFYLNPDVDKLLDQGMAEADFNKRKAIFDRVQAIVHGDLAIIPLWYDRQVAVAAARIKNYQPVMSSDYWPLTRVTKIR